VRGTGVQPQVGPEAAPHPQNTSAGTCRYSNKVFKQKDGIFLHTSSNCNVKKIMFLKEKIFEICIITYFK